MLKATKFRIYPTAEQRYHLAQSFGCCRFAWNYALNLTNEAYKATGKGLNRFAIQKEITNLKKEYEWMNEPYSQCLQVVALNLSRAFINFFEGRASFPQFKSKHRNQSISYPQNVSIVEDGIKFPKMGVMYAKIHRPIEGKIKTVTVSMNALGQYFASVLVDDEKDIPEKSVEGKAVGIDLGLTHFAITSDGSKFDNPRWIVKHERNLRAKQKRLSRRQKGSNSRNKTRKQVAGVHNKISRCREDFHHKLSRRIVDENQVIVVENLAVKNMVKNHCLAKAISQVGWGQFCTMLKYKAEWEGKVYIEVDRFFPSSKTCNVCLNQVRSLPLDVRTWQCQKCQTTHDRDVNAAKNIRDEGLRILSSGTGEIAYRPDVRRDSRGRKKSTISQSVG
ncbi:RNA-guided endonuclease InsQ/TnpB family protein [Oscillatoria salina]|uniref:RNA-guided endonuclease InsQ/TnpB family protein n=1 Tax=Oscillatoria salina TaxID=331517 RepID=UPI0013BA593F|nr:RNA-guided endonuclease TnpB family protein [Oscillatoria salina]MBZ8182077.1 IS200/IS605 family element transposase accessory protein TnpB [Oscillatoria salina IIICB1]NET89489.1 IS200/IS605 family element transposase accessory protein TnpB [Kamptonema sp. SIO1D9]